MKILITGAGGFVGKNLVANLNEIEIAELLEFDINNDYSDLEKFALEADFVIHLAGVNRPQNEEEFTTGNTDFTKQLLELLKKNKKRPSVLISSSIQAELDNPYGKSKKAAEDAVFSYAEDTGANVCVYRLQNAFGKWSKPNYNSVVSTFCYNSSHGIPHRIDDPEKELSLIYIDDIVNEFVKAINGEENRCDDNYCRVLPEYKVTLGRLAEMVDAFEVSRNSFIHSDSRLDSFTQKLYATWLSYLDEDDFSKEANMKNDDRGFFAELIKSPHFGQISVSRTKPGITRGNHWHNSKVEKFIVVEGEALIEFRKIDADKVISYAVSGEKIEIVDIPPGYTHSITNTGNTDVLTIFWSGELFDPNEPDTFFMEV